MAEITKVCSVVANGTDTREYPCGHTGPVHWDHILFGHTYKVDPGLTDPNKCGQCHLNEIAPQLGQCTKCGRPIFPQADCITYEGRLCCLSTTCGPGPIAGDPGVWDGTQFVDGLIAGTVKLVPARP